MTMVGNKRGTNVRPHIIAYFASHQNRSIHLSELANKLEDDPSRIRVSIATLIRHDRQTSAGILDTRVPGESWIMLTCHQGDPECDCAIPILGEVKEHPYPRVTPTKESKGPGNLTDLLTWMGDKPRGAFDNPEHLFQQIGKARGNAIILKCEDGTIWRAEQV